MVRRCVEVWGTDEKAMRVYVDDAAIIFEFDGREFSMCVDDCEPLANFLREAGED